MKNVSDVLIVSESEALPALIKFALGRWWGVVIRIECSAAAGTAALSERVPQIAVVDAALPDADAFGRILAVKTHVIAVNAPGPLVWAAQITSEPFQPHKLHAAIEGLPD